MRRTNRLRLLVPMLVAHVLFLFVGVASLFGECIGGPPLKPVRCVRGFVTDGSGARIPNARVTILRGTTEIVSVKTDANGRLSLDHLDPGSYEIHAEARDFAMLHSPITVAGSASKCKRALQIVLGFGFECDTHIEQVKAEAAN
jgi:Carboxypeptidase regulatory-like domain